MGIYEPCWQYQDTQTCNSSTYSGNCDAIAATSGCTQTNSLCTSFDPDGICDTYDNTYTCTGQINSPPSGVTTLPTTYTVTQTTDDQCGSFENNSSCVAAGQTCTDGPSTKIINGDPVFENCWNYQTNYTCLNSANTTDCGQYPQTCTSEGTTCLASNAQGQCMDTQYTYACGAGTAVTPSQLVCGGRIYCINGSCDSTSYTPNSDFAKGAAWMNVVMGMAGQLNPTTLTVFDGKANPVTPRSRRSRRAAATTDGASASGSLAARPRRSSWPATRPPT